MIIELGPGGAEEDFRDRDDGRTRIAKMPLSEDPGVPWLDRVVPRRARPILTPAPKPRARGTSRRGLPTSLLLLGAIAVSGAGFAASRWIGGPARHAASPAATRPASAPAARSSGFASLFSSRATPAPRPTTKRTPAATAPRAAIALHRHPRSARAITSADPPFDAPTPAAEPAPASGDFGNGGDAVAISDSDLLGAGRILYRGGDYARAQDAFKKALKSNEGDGEARFWLAMSESQQRKSWRACHNFRRYVDLFPEGSHAAEAKRKVADCDG